MTEQNIDFESGHVVIKSLKKRGRTIFRTVPLSPQLLDLLRKLVTVGKSSCGRLWPWCRMTGYRRIREVMQAARIAGPHATPKGLRHAFGVCAIQSNVPLNILQRWLGHSDIKTTAIYANALGPEERELASRTWKFGTGRAHKRPRRSGGVRGGDQVMQETRQTCFERSAICASASLIKLGISLNSRVAGVAKELTTADELMNVPMSV